MNQRIARKRSVYSSFGRLFHLFAAMRTHSFFFPRKEEAVLQGKGIRPEEQKSFGCPKEPPPGFSQEKTALYRSGFRKPVVGLDESRFKNDENNRPLYPVRSSLSRYFPLWLMKIYPHTSSGAASSQ